MKRSLFFAAVIAFSGLSFAQTEDEKRLSSILPAIIERSEAQYRRLENAAQKVRVDKDGSHRIPHGYIAAENKLDMRAIFWWTSGHFPGSLWYLYEATGKDEWKCRAIDWTDTQAPAADYTGNHDTGFRMFCPLGNGRRLSPGHRERYDALLVRSAATLCKRYHEGLGLLRSWGKIDETKNFLVIPDNIMNLELHL